jgi:ATP-dependent protease ClpP protease subunit
VQGLDIRASVTSDSAELAIYGEITEGNASQILSALDYFKGKDIILSVYSTGGDVFAGLGIRDALASRNVTARVYGLAASAAALILTGAKRVEMTPFSSLMIHKAYKVSANGEKQYDEDTDRINKMQTEAFSKKSGKRKDIVERWMAAGDKFFNAQEAIDAGLADAIHTPEKMAASMDTMQPMSEILNTEQPSEEVVLEAPAVVSDPGDEQPEPTEEIEVEIPVNAATAVQAAFLGKFKAKVNVGKHYGEIVAGLITENKGIKAQLDEANAKIEELAPKADAAANAEAKAEEATAKVAEMAQEVEKLKTTPLTAPVMPDAAPAAVVPAAPAQSGPAKTVLEGKIEKNMSAIDAAIQRRGIK